MKYLSLLSLGILILGLTACGNGCRKACTTTTVTTSTSDGAVEVTEYVDKEDLDEQELVEVMVNK